jgi:hypothetical protein
VRALHTIYDLIDIQCVLFSVLVATIFTQRNEHLHRVRFDRYDCCDRCDRCDRCSLTPWSLLLSPPFSSCLCSARFVKRTNSPPQLVCLSPYRTTDVEGLLVNQLPFSEDFRLFSFPPLPETPLDAEDEYSTEGAGTQGVTHAQMAAAGSLIDALMLPSTTTGGETKEEGDGGDGGDGGGRARGLTTSYPSTHTTQRCSGFTSA